MTDIDGFVLEIKERIKTDTTDELKPTKEGWEMIAEAFDSVKSLMRSIERERKEQRK